MQAAGTKPERNTVTPCVGVWIEITLCHSMRSFAYESLPAWECGLKYLADMMATHFDEVTPCVGVWIEIPASKTNLSCQRCHSLRGSVD